MAGQGKGPARADGTYQQTAGSLDEQRMGKGLP
jgi:hypothetical protein